MRDHENFYIDGAWVEPEGKGTIEVINASTEEVMGHVPEGTPADVDRAVAAAKAAFDTWGYTPKEERGKYLQRLAEGLGARSAEIGEVISQEVGMPIMWSNMIQAGLPVGNAANYVEILDNFEFEEEIGNSLVVKTPVDVVGAITPWNYPLHQIICKVAPALAAGCTVVLKPSEVAPLNAFILAEVIDEVGFPAGVFNLVTGVGSVVGERIAEHPDVNMVSFTGSTAAGKRVAKVAADTVKRVSLELGGKSANILLDDADFEKVVGKGLFACYMNSGQTCTAHTRMLVPRDRQDEVIELARTAAEGFTVGPASGDATLGPVISATQRDRVRSYIQKGIDEGATLVAGGPDAPEGLDTGYFIQPTVFANVDPDMTIAQEEIFGPVLSIIPYEDEEDAISIANGTLYGLAGGVQSASQERAEAVARRMRAGQIDINGGSYNILAPFGGFGQSGYGRENGVYGLEEFLEAKSIQR